ncbi:MAG: SGNH/GDSL hydrolase family protein [Anaerolineae bacterium]|nr:SGNH/GDSL hydrolase family protein [Anaerolineae bacterium]MCO5189924.1 SGNH/GDSL hydrolase family protein [Anaerolineae bacterium]
MKKWLIPVILMLGGMCVALIIVEIGVRIMARNTPYTVMAPNARWEFEPAPGAMPGIEGVSVYSMNADGVRGDPYDPDNENILAIGGSTTQVRYLDDSEAWPYLVQQNLNAAGAEPPIWVGNIGRSGHGIVEHIYHLRYFVPQYDIDTVLLMVGVNDMLPALYNPDTYDAAADTPEQFGRIWDNAFSTRPLYDRDVPRPFPTNLALWNLGEKVWWRIEQMQQAQNALAEDSAGENYIVRRAQLQAAPEVIDTLPDLTAALDQYERNMDTFIDEAEAQGIRPILITQPYVWSENISAEAEALLWMGRVGAAEAPTARYTPAALASGMAQFNQRLLQVCQERDVECIDLAAAINGVEAYFYDDVHFNEAGSQAVADVISYALKE